MEKNEKCTFSLSQNYDYSLILAMVMHINRGNNRAWAQRWGPNMYPIPRPHCEGNFTGALRIDPPWHVVWDTTATTAHRYS